MSDSFVQEISGNSLIIRLSGRLDAKAVEGAKSEFKAITSKQVVINMSELSFIDSTGLGLIVSSFRRIMDNNGKLSLCSLSPQVQTIFELTRLHKIFDIYETEALALTAYDD